MKKLFRNKLLDVAISTTSFDKQILDSAMFCELFDLCPTAARRKIAYSRYALFSADNFFISRVIKTSV